MDIPERPEDWKPKDAPDFVRFYMGMLLHGYAIGWGGGGGGWSIVCSIKDDVHVMVGAVRTMACWGGRVGSFTPSPMSLALIIDTLSSPILFSQVKILSSALA